MEVESKPLGCAAVLTSDTSTAQGAAPAAAATMKSSLLIGMSPPLQLLAAVVEPDWMSGEKDCLMDDSNE